MSTPFTDIDLDELDGLPTATPAATTKTTTTAVQAEAAPAAKVNSNVQSWDADDAEDIASSILKSNGPPYVKVSEGQPARIAFIPGTKVIGAPVHYDGTNKKYYLCESKTGKRATCCQKLPDAKGRAAAFVFVYKNTDPKSGKLDPKTVPVVEVGIFTMSRSNWDDVRGAVEEDASVYDVDYRISVSEKQLARKVAVISRKARWHDIKADALALAAPFLADPSQLTRALGRKYEDRLVAADVLLRQEPDEEEDEDEGDGKEDDDDDDDDKDDDGYSE